MISPVSVSPLLEWDESYATGVEEIDEQHMILVHTLNEASQELAVDARIETLEKITQNLLSYALYHFETEEELMIAYGYKDATAEAADEHMSQHRGFSEQVVAVREGINSGTPIAPDELLQFLNDWLINHILKTDKRLGEFIVAKRLGQAGGLA